MILLLLMAGQVEAQVPVLDSVCSGAVRRYRVDGEAGSTYSWILTPPSGPSVTLPSNADTIEIAWIYPSGTYGLQAIQHALNGCDADAVFGEVFIFPQPDVSAGPDDIVCVGKDYKLIDADASDYSSLLWTTDGDGTFDNTTWLNATYTPGPNDILNGVVTLTLTGWGLVEEGGCEPSVSKMELRVVYFIVPQFEPIDPICLYSTPPALPDTSLEGITGTWNPAVINTDFLGVFPYTFVPDNPLQCGIDTTIMITITDQIIPQFDPIGPLCIFSTPPALPDSSLEGITGTWEPDTILTDVAGNFTFTFTPDDPSQCGVVTTLTVAVVTEIQPVFGPIGPYCQYSLPPALPDTSINGIAGTWDPPVIHTDLPGSFDYIFMPYPDQCGLDTTITIVINPQVTPVFTPIDTLCQYSQAPELPDVSLNGITGIWIPAWISTATPGTFTFTFIPNDPTQCGVMITMDVTILPELVPVFEPIEPLCQNSTPPALPDTSLNGISGTWVPPFITTDATGTFFYTFTPDASYECAMPATIIVTVVWDVLPEFDPVGPLCQYSPGVTLPDTSLNGITGSWDPPVVNTSDPGTFIYTFTPDPDQCSIETTMDIIILPEVTPEFDPIGSLCLNSTPPPLPGTSLNGINGTWDPPVIITTTEGTFEFTFTPDDGQCSVAITIEVEISDEIIPEFDPIGPFCQNLPAPDLPSVSENGLTGTWVPSFIDTSVPGTFTFTFTPDPDQCGVVTQIDISIVNEITPEFNQIGPLCQYSEPPDLPDVSNNGIQGTWVPLNIDTDVTGTFTYTFTPDEGQCGVVTTMDITITTGITPQFDPLGPFCKNSPVVTLPGVSLDGITGTWDPAVVNTQYPGTFDYTFTPDEGQCAVQVIIQVEITAPPLVSQVIVTNETDGLGNGSIEIIATGSTSLLFYSVTGGGSWQTNNGLFENLTHGLFTCIVMDEHNCDTTFTVELTNVIVTELEAITIPGRHCLGDAAIIPIVVDHFHNVAVFQLKLSYNVDKLYCEGFASVHPLLADHFSGWIDVAAGEITLQWHNPTELTFIGAETVTELVFTPKEPGLGELAWYTDPTDSYFENLEGAPIPAQFFTDDLVIYDPPEILLQESRTVCEGDSVTIYSAATGLYPPISYVWTYPDGSIHLSDPVFDSILESNAGSYTLLATDSLGCSDQKSIQLIVSDIPVADFHGSDTLTKAPGYILEAGSGQAYYLWNTGETTDQITIDSTGLYRVEMITHVGCYGADSVFLFISEEVMYECLFIPNAFTPNGDGLNDVFMAVSQCPLSYFRMEIYNRWGEMFFVSEDINTGWDGKKNGNLCPGDAYVYKIAYRPIELPATERAIVKAGVVVIVE